MVELNRNQKHEKSTRDLLLNGLKSPYILIVAGLFVLMLMGLLIGLLGREIWGRADGSPTPTEVTAEVTPTVEATLETPTPTMPASLVLPTPTPTPTLTLTPELTFFEGPWGYGYSYDGRPLEAYRLGTGASRRLLVGGIHGGYEWNTIHMLSDTLTYFQENPHLIPAEVTLYLIPNMNPDGYAAGTDAVVARMNGNGVDLNRNWDYEWQPTATHGTRQVKAGDAPFSEPETAALRDFILENDIELAIFYHSALGVVFSGADRQNSATYELTEYLSAATGYPHQVEGVIGQITTGDAIDWLSTIGIAAAEVELTTHDAIDEGEWQQNLNGILAFLSWALPENREVIVDSPDEVSREMITYVVQIGDSLLQIAVDNDISLEDLMYLNEIDDADAIYEGQEILIPVPATSD